MTPISTLAQSELVEHGETVPAERGAPAGGAAQPLGEPSDEMREPSDEMPSAEVQAAYREVVAQAVAEFDAGRFAEARALFLRAHELWPSARTFRTLGMTAFDLRLYVRALDELQRALDDRKRPLTDEQRAQVEALLEQTRGFVGRYRVRLVPDHATLWVDGELHPVGDAPLVLAVGEHLLTVRAKDHAELRRVLVVQGREDEEIELRLARDAPSAQERDMGAAQARADGGSSLRRLALPLTALGVGAAGFVTSGIFTRLALRDKRHLAKLCPDETCPPEYEGQVEEMKRFAHVATVSLVVGAVGAALGTYLWLRAWKRSREQGRPGPQLTLRGASLRGSF